MSRLAAHFLCMDESDPKVDYNAEDYSSKPVEYYLNEAFKTLEGLKYLHENLKDGLTETEIQTIAYDGKKEEKIKLVMAGQNVDRATAEKLVEEFDKEQAKNETGNIISDKLK